MLGAPRFARIFVCALLIAAMVPVVSAQAVVPPGTTFYVDVATGDNGNTGGATDPFESIGHALKGAEAGDTVVVAPGTYSSSETTSSGEEFPLYVGPGVTLKSSDGAAKTTIDADYRDGVIVITDKIWDERARTDIDVPPIAMNPAIIEGLTITRGAREFGGGIDIEGADAILRDLVISKNFSWIGGGVYAESSITLVENCEFLDNGWDYDMLQQNAVSWADQRTSIDPPEVPEFPAMRVSTEYGGGLAAFESYITVKGSLFDGNAAYTGGGGIGAEFAKVEVSDTDFKFNLAIGDIGSDSYKDVSDQVASTDAETLDQLGAFGGGAIAAAYVDLAVADSDFDQNIAYLGGGIFVASEMLTTVEGCEFGENLSIEGAAILAVSGWEEWGRIDGIETNGDLPPSGERWGVLVDQSVFEDNWAISGIVNSYDASMTVQNSLFDNNMTETSTIMSDGKFILPIPPPVGVESTDYEPPHVGVVNSTFTENEAWLSVFAPWAYVSNVICWGNDRTVEGWDVVGQATDIGLEPEPEPEPLDVIAAWVEYSDLEYGAEWELSADGPAGEGNISEDPMFMWPEDRDFSLIAGSPCIDTGTSTKTPTYDLPGIVRPMDGDDDGVAAHDMGAYEYVYEGDVRTGGADRYTTSALAAQEYFDSSDVVVIARGDVFADGLAAAGLCGVFDAPLLLTRTYALPAVTKVEIERLGATKAFIMGGTGAVNEDVADALEDMGLTVERIGGATRYHTAAMIADKIESENGTPTATFIARGDLFADALTVSPVAYGIKAPILLVRPDQLPEATVDVLGDLSPSSVVIAGGTGAVSANVQAGIESVTVAADRIDGADRYATAVAFSEFAIGMGWAHWDTVGLATGVAFPDALTGGPAVGEAHGVLLLTPPNELYAGVEKVLTDNAAMIGRLDVLGGSGAITDAVKDAAAAAIE